MTALSYQDWSGETPRDNARPQLPLWAALSILAHLLIVAWILMAPDPEPMTMADRSIQDRPAIDIVALPPAPVDATPLPDNVTPDRPTLTPPPRKLDPTSDMPAVPRDIVDPRALEEFLRRQALRDKETAGGQGSTWTTCSLLSPERRLLEPACDGMMIKPGSAPGVAASLQPPDAATLAAIQKFNKPRTAQDEADAIGDNDTNTDGSYRNQTDEVYGKMPWEK